MKGIVFGTPVIAASDLIYEAAAAILDRATVHKVSENCSRSPNSQQSVG